MHCFCSALRATHTACAANSLPRCASSPHPCNPRCYAALFTSAELHLQSLQPICHLGADLKSRMRLNVGCFKLNRARHTASSSLVHPVHSSQSHTTRSCCADRGCERGAQRSPDCGSARSPPSGASAPHAQRGGASQPGSARRTSRYRLSHGRAAFGWCRQYLCCLVLSHAVLCCHVPCCAVLCCAMLCLLCDNRRARHMSTVILQTATRRCVVPYEDSEVQGIILADKPQAGWMASALCAAFNPGQCTRVLSAGAGKFWRRVTVHGRGLGRGHERGCGRCRRLPSRRLEGEGKEGA